MNTKLSSMKFERRRDIKTIKLNNKFFEFDADYNNQSFNLVFALALISLNAPRVNEILHTFNIVLIDKDNKIIDY